MQLFQYLSFVPAGTSFILGTVYLLFGEGRPAVKIVGTAWFLVALYLQFGSGYPLAGLLAQVALALVLAIWKRAAAGASSS